MASTHFTIKRISTARLILGVLAFVSSFDGFSQAQIVLNGAYVNIRNEAVLVLNNPSSNTIVRNSGWIISEGQNNIVKWNIGNNTGSYVIPFGYSNVNYIPFSFTISSAGSNEGSIGFSTYRTSTFENINEAPVGVTHMNSPYVTGDASEYVIDRFWGIDALSYSSRPSLSNVTFSYTDDGDNGDIKSGNLLVESKLTAQRWNSDVSEWQNFIFGSANTSTNTVDIQTLENTHLYRWWTLVDIDHTLPVNIKNFQVKCKGNAPLLFWDFYIGKGNDNFIIEKSYDAIEYFEIAKVVPSSSNLRTNYSYLDENESASCYYKLKIVDGAGKTGSYPALFYKSCNESDEDQIWSSKTTINFQTNDLKNSIGYIRIFDVRNKEIINRPASIVNGKYSIDASLPDGVYIVEFFNGKKVLWKKVIINK